MFSVEVKTISPFGWIATLFVDGVYHDTYSALTPRKAERKAWRAVEQGLEPRAMPEALTVLSRDDLYNSFGVALPPAEAWSEARG